MGNVACQNCCKQADLTISNGRNFQIEDQNIHIPDTSQAKIVESSLTLAPKIERIYQMHKYNNDNKIQGSKCKPYYIFHLRAYYEGEWKHRAPDGFGRMFFDNGSFYEGNFCKGKVTDEHGLFIFSDGTFYKGSLVEGKAEGRGFYKCDKFSYVGEWENDKPHGKGRQESDICVYMGDFQKGQKHGEGTILWTDGSNYKGSFQNNKLNGYGIFTTNDYVYKGEYLNNKKHGRGKIKYRWTNQQYQGIFKEDKKMGTFHYKDQEGGLYSSVFENDDQLTPFQPISFDKLAILQQTQTRAMIPPHHDYNP